MPPPSGSFGLEVDRGTATLDLETFTGGIFDALPLAFFVGSGSVGSGDGMGRSEVGGWEESVG